MNLYEPCSTCAVAAGYLEPDSDLCPDCVDGVQPTDRAVEIHAKAAFLFAHPDGKWMKSGKGYARRREIWRERAWAALLELRRQL